MLIGLTGNHRKGYNVRTLIELIGNTIDREGSQHVALVGIGNLGRAVPGFIRKAETRMNVVAAFAAGRIKGILNFTFVHLDVTPEIYLKNYDIITSLEEIGFFI